MPDPKKESGGFIQDALNVVQEGLRSIQSLQKQTAETHQQFLAAQTEANRTLQKMMANTQRLAERALGLPATAESLDSPRPSQTENIRPENHTAALAQPGDVARQVPEPREPGPTTPPSDSGPAIPDSAAAPETAPARTSSNRNLDHITGGLIEVVSQLTGYPPETIGMDMDIEADLGIDSIKRVEILSTLEERIPDLPGVSPEEMGRLKTLGQIVSYLGENSESNPELPAAAETGAPSDAPGPDRRTAVAETRLSDTLLETVSRLTGYPKETLGLDLDIEADLGIDSIKRVEILSMLEDELPELPSVAPDMLSSLKTLGQIITYFSDADISRDPNETSAAAPPESTSAPANCPETPNDTAGAETSVLRRTVRVVGSPLRQVAPFKPPNGKILLFDGQSELGEAIASEFRSKHLDAETIEREQIDDYLSGKKSLPSTAGLLLISGADHEDPPAALVQSFRIAKIFAPALQQAAHTGSAFFGTLTRLDGAFGFKGGALAAPLVGGMAGLSKTASREWPDVCCRALDVNPGWKDSEQIAKSVVAEFLHPDPTGPTEIGLSENGRCLLELVPSPLEKTDFAAFPFEAGDVVVISGGAKGIGAAAALALARTCRPTLILLGRTPEPTDEPNWLLSLSEPAEVKKAILENEFSGQVPTPKHIETSFARHMSNRAVHGTLDRLRQTGSRAEYFSVDIRDADRVAAVIQQVRRRYGPIKGLLHGAGVLKDRRIVDKTVEQFSHVFDTKVKGLLSLLKAVENDPLSGLVFFSSVAARFGNSGQVDYAMANEAMNKLAMCESAKRPSCRVVSINWGPWNGGMVSSTLKREFRRRGIPLISMQAGTEALLKEIRLPAAMAPVEVVLGAEVHSEISRPRAEIKPPERASEVQASRQLSLSFMQELDIENYPVLQSHVIDGIPVVPFALMTEWFGHAALHENPGLTFQGLEEMRLLKGIRLDRHPKSIRLLAGKARKTDPNHFVVDLELRNGIKSGQEIIHSRARAVLSDTLPTAPEYRLPAYLTRNYEKTPQQIYDQILFHGIQLRGIHSISHVSAKGVLAELLPAPEPARWVQKPLRNKWIADPLVLDCAFQVGVIWSFEEMGYVGLPSYTAWYRQYCDRFPSKGVTVVLEITDATANKMQGDFTFLDSNEKVIAQLKGYEAVMSESLYKAFKPKLAGNG